MSRTLMAGVGKADITSKEGAVIGELLTEKARPHIPSELLDKRIAIDDPLFARALVLDDGETRLALITLDATAVGCRTTSQNILDDSADDFVPNLRDRLSEELGIPVSNVAVCASHTHPPGRTLCDDGEQLERTVRAVRQAVENLEPAAVGVSSARNDSLTINRSPRMRDGRHNGGSPMAADEDIASPGPVDPEIGVLRVDRLDGTPLAVLYNFSSHILYNSPRDNISAGFPGFASRCLEESLGYNAMALFVQGAFGDVIEVCSPTTDRINPRSAYETGLMLAQSVLQAHRRSVPAPAVLKVVSRTVPFPLRTDIPEVIDELKREQAALLAALGDNKLRLNFKSFLQLYLLQTLNPEFPTHHAMRYLRADAIGDISLRALDDRNRLDVKNYLANVRTMEKMCRNEFRIQTLAKHREIVETLGGKTVPSEIQGMRIGDCVLITAPMEVLTETGLKVKQASPFPHTYIVSIANGYLHYSPPASYYGLGSYEAVECLLAPEWEERFDRTVREILEQLQCRD